MTLTAADLRFIHMVAASRGAKPAAEVDQRSLDAAVAYPASEEGGKPAFATPFARAAALTEAAMRVFPVASGPTGLLVAFCALRLEGYQLAAPQGVAAGMIDGVNRERVSAAGLAAWLEDRSVAMR